MKARFWMIVSISLAGSWVGAQPLKPQNFDKINSAKDEDDPFPAISASGVGHLYYTVAGEIFYAKRTAAGFQPGVVFPGIQERGIFRSPFVEFPRNNAQYPQTVFFARNVDDRDGGKKGNFDLYYRIRTGASAELNVSVPIHTVCTPDDEMHPWLTNDGKLYFSRKTSAGWRVFVSQRSKDGKQFGAPTQVELPPEFHHATLSPNGTTMYLQGPLGKDRWGLFRSVQNNGKWSQPEELTDLNHSGGLTGDRSPTLTRSGALLLFASDRPGGKGGLDLWSIPVNQLEKLN